MTKVYKAVKTSVTDASCYPYAPRYSFFAKGWWECRYGKGHRTHMLTSAGLIAPLFVFDTAQNALDFIIKNSLGHCLSIHEIWRAEASNIRESPSTISWWEDDFAKTWRGKRGSIETRPVPKGSLVADSVVLRHRVWPHPMW